jgi:cyclase
VLKKRLIPSLLYRENVLVKGKKFISKRKIGSILESIKVYNLREVDELILLDVDKKNNGPDLNIISEAASECFVPLAVGGGIKNLNMIYNVLKSGADKVCINSHAIKNPNFIKDASKEFGSQCIVISVDYISKNKKNLIYTDSGKAKTDFEVLNFLKMAEDLGAGEFLLNSINRDGMMNGYDYEFIRMIKNKIKIPLIASGGAGNCDHILKLFSYCKADAASASSLFHFTEITPKEVKIFLEKNKINVRI